jgi:hypothetical protein
MNPLLVVDKYNHLVPNFRFCYNLLDVIVNIVLLLDDFARENALLVSSPPETQNSLNVPPTPILTSVQNLTCTMTLLNDLLASVFSCWYLIIKSLHCLTTISAPLVQEQRCDGCIPNTTGHCASAIEAEARASSTPHAFTPSSTFAPYRTEAALEVDPAHNT